MESFQNKPWFEADEDAHGKNGPLLTAPHDPTPISNRVLESFQSSGLELKPDMFSTGESSSGCGHAVRSIYKGVRTTSVDYLGSAGSQDGIDILTSLYVDKVIFDSSKSEGEGLRAVGVQVTDSKSNTTIFSARKEIILTAGTYGSPAILLRSGIGPTAGLSQYGIKTVVDLPGVGKNLMDHLVSHRPHPCHQK